MLCEEWNGVPCQLKSRKKEDRKRGLELRSLNMRLAAPTALGVAESENAFSCTDSTTSCSRTAPWMYLFHICAWVELCEAAVKVLLGTSMR